MTNKVLIQQNHMKSSNNHDEKQKLYQLLLILNKINNCATIYKTYLVIFL